MRRARRTTTSTRPAPTGQRTTLEVVATGRRRRLSRRRTVTAVLALLIVAGFAVTLMVGQTFYPPGDVVRVVLGQEVPGASFTVAGGGYDKRTKTDLYRS